MKRSGKQVLSDFFLKKPKSGEDVTTKTNRELTNILQTAEAELPHSASIVQISDQTVGVVPSPNNVRISDGVERNLPDCWKLSQFQDFQKKYDGLLVRNKKLGCNYCAKIDSTKTKGIHVSIEWKRFNIEASGKNKVIQHVSIQRKLMNQIQSKFMTNQICIQQLKDRSKDVILKYFDQVNEKYADSTRKMFKTVYSIAKRCIPFSDIQNEIEPKAKNELSMGVGFHSCKTAAKIVDHIA